MDSKNHCVNMKNMCQTRHPGKATTSKAYLFHSQWLSFSPDASTAQLGCWRSPAEVQRVWRAHVISEDLAGTYTSVGHGHKPYVKNRLVTYPFLLLLTPPVFNSRKGLVEGIDASCMFHCVAQSLESCHLLVAVPKKMQNSAISH